MSSRRRRPKRERVEQHPPAPQMVVEGELHEGNAMGQKSKRIKMSQNDIFSLYMMEDTFRLLLRFFVSEAGLVDGVSLRSIMLVSRQWYKAANAKSLWTIPEVLHANKENSVSYVPRRPSPLIREICTFPAVGDNNSNLIGFVNLGRRNTDDGKPSYNARERATGKIFYIDILDADDECAVREAASAHHLTGNSFLTSQQEKDSQHLFLPIGMESSNGKVVRWFGPMKTMSTLPAPLLEDAKIWIRQLLLAVKHIHSTHAIHGCVHPKNIHVNSSTESETAIQLLCPSLYPIVSCFQPPANEAKYLSPELLIPLSIGLKVLPSREGDMWAVGCIFAELIHGKPIFGQLSGGWYDGGRTNSLSLYARKMCRVVGRPPAFVKSMRSHRHDEFPVNPAANLRQVLSTLDESGLDLIAKLLSPDPTTRPTAEEALAHPFLSEKCCDQPELHSMSDSTTERGITRISLYISRETQLNISSPTRKHVRMDAWATLVDYVIEIVEVFDLDIGAAFRAMSYFDHFFSSYQRSGTFSNRRCQLVAGTCLYISCKCFETRLTKGDLVFSADNMLNANDISIAEEAILHELNWKLSNPTILDFVETFSDELEFKEESKQRRMARYVSELALQSQVYLSFKPSLIASCVVALALVAVGSVDAWPEALEQATGYLWNDLEQCMMALSSDIHHLRATMPELKIISRRYRKKQNGRVSLIHMPRITVFNTLRNPRA